MADHYGALPLDIPTVDEAEPCGDPALRVVADFLKAVINARATTAWRSISPACNPPKQGKDFPVNGAYTHDPKDAKFSEKSLPAIYIFRSQGGLMQDDAEDYRVARSTWTCWWIYQPTSEEKEALRSPFSNAIGKIVDDALDRGRDPSYVRAGETEAIALSYDAVPDSIKTSVATETSSQTYSGAALNGAIGGAVMTPPRSSTATLAGPASSFVVGSTITWTGLNALDQTVVIEREIDGSGTVRATYDFKKITAIDVDGQAGTGGTFEFGTDAIVGHGTDIYQAAGLQRIGASRPTRKIINMGSREDPIPYDALEILLDVEERLTPDLDQFDQLDDQDGAAGDGSGVTVTFVRDDGSVSNTAVYD